MKLGYYFKFAQIKAISYGKRYGYYPAAYMIEISRRTAEFVHARYTAPSIEVLLWPFKKGFSLIFNRYSAGVLLVAVSALAAIWHFDKERWHGWTEKLLEYLKGHLSPILQRMGELTFALPSLEGYVEFFTNLPERGRTFLNTIPEAFSKVFNNLKNGEIASNIALLTGAFSVGKVVGDANPQKLLWKILKSFFGFCRLTAGTLYGWAVADAGVMIFPILMPTAPVLLPATALAGFGMAHMLPVAAKSVAIEYEYNDHYQKLLQEEESKLEDLNRSYEVS